jgi:hypothetical protein
VLQKPVEKNKNSNFDRQIRTRLIFLFFLFSLALVALVYGLAFNSIAISKPEELTLGEPAVVLDTTVGGLARLDTGAIGRTYAGQEPPSKCPT